MPTKKQLGKGMMGTTRTYYFARMYYLANLNYLGLEEFFYTF